MKKDNQEKTNPKDNSNEPVPENGICKICGETFLIDGQERYCPKCYKEIFASEQDLPKEKPVIAYRLITVYKSDYCDFLAHNASTMISHIQETHGIKNPVLYLSPEEEDD